MTRSLRVPYMFRRRTKSQDVVGEYNDSRVNPSLLIWDIRASTYTTSLGHKSNVCKAVRRQDTVVPSVSAEQHICILLPDLGRRRQRANKANRSNLL